MSGKLGKLICGNPEKEVDLDLLVSDVNRTICANEPLHPHNTRCDLRLLCMAVERLAARTPSPSGAREMLAAAHDAEMPHVAKAIREAIEASSPTIMMAFALRAIESALRSQQRGEDG